MGRLNEQIAGAFRVPPWKIGDLIESELLEHGSGENTYVNSHARSAVRELGKWRCERDLLTVPAIRRLHRAHSTARRSCATT